ncbi:hypothetical protein [Chitinimonas koreensis]|uniref:hypothetical protein n=1 Tax=Chitinimonas koreensis TaxID=356302 RepID=UPI000410DFE0|nr:hypothetical protein [Chitinimonas koreensis]QNM94722.1 acetylglutamate kinase [Chitinimonas koreensis]
MPADLPRRLERLHGLGLPAGALPFLQVLQRKAIVIVDAVAPGEAAGARQAFARDVALLALAGARPVVVHGGPLPFPADARLPGCLATNDMRAMLAGINRELVQLIGRYGPRAMSLSGQEADKLAHAPPAGEEPDGLLGACLDRGMLPVLMPLATDTAGKCRLVSPLQLGSQLARRLPAEAMVVMGDPAAVSELARLTGADGREALERWLAHHPRAAAAGLARALLGALGRGVQTVLLIDAARPDALIAELLAEESTGAVFCRRSAAQLLAASAAYLLEGGTPRDRRKPAAHP